MTTSTPDAPAAPARRRRGGTVGDMVRSLGLLLVIVVVIVLVRGRGGGEQVHALDPTSAYDGASHVARYQLMVPTGLGTSWRVTSAGSTQAEGSANGPVTLTVGFVTPNNAYAQLVESDQAGLASVKNQLADQARQTGTVTFDGEQWQRWPSAKSGETVYVRTASGVTYSVTGNASQQEVSTLIGSLAPYRER